jgi:GxxExxY protein
MEKEPFLFSDETYRILGACFEVYKDKGCGFLEPVYQECLGVEFGLRKLPAVAKPSFELEYKGVKLTQTYIPDYFCFGEVIVELKALSQLEDRHRAQVINYLKATKKQVGLLINFGHYPKLEHERLIASDRWEAPPDLQA